MPFRHSPITVLILLLPAILPAQSSRRVAQLAFGPAYVQVDATDDGKVTLTAVQNHLEGRAVLSLPEVGAWLDTALVVTTARDPRRPGVKWTYSVAGPALFLYRVVDARGEEYVVSVGSALKVSLVLGAQDARALLNDVAAAARIARQLAASRTGACSLGIAVALPRGVRLLPSDSAALWMDHAREQIEIRLATAVGSAADAGRGAWFVAGPDGAASAISVDAAAPAPASADLAPSPALTALRDAITAAGAWHAFRGAPGGRPVRIRATLAPRCPA